MSTNQIEHVVIVVKENHGFDNYYAFDYVTGLGGKKLSSAQFVADASAGRLPSVAWVSRTRFRALAGTTRRTARSATSARGRRSSSALIECNSSGRTPPAAARSS